jgi:hypothetical protein
MTSDTAQRLSRSVAAVIVCGLIVSMSARESSAQEISRTPFSKFGSQSCLQSGSCTVDFGVVPGGDERRYEITFVSCYVSIGHANGRVGYWYLSANRHDDIVGRIHLRPHFLGRWENSATYNASESGLFVVYGGGTIAVTTSRDGSTPGAVPFTACTISGYDVQLAE